MLSDLRHRLRALFRRSNVERELDAELQFHLDRQLEEDARRGVPRSESIRRARHDFGGLDQLKEACRDERGVGPLERAGQDIGQAWRILRKHAGFTATVVATLALGIGATTTMFSVVDVVVLRSLPYPASGRLIQIGAAFGGVRVSSLAAPDAFEIERRARTVAAVAATRSQALDLSGDGAPERLDGSAVSSSYFKVLGVQPARGSAFSTDLDRKGAAAVALISHELWQRRFNADAGIVGRAIVLNGVPHNILGVMPKGFRGPEAIGQHQTAVWIPAGRVEPSVVDRGDASWGTIARLADGIDVAAAAAEIEGIGKALTAEYPKDDARRFWVSPLTARTVGEAGTELWLVFGAVGLLWVIACANMANLFLVRTTERYREMAVRAALGAGRGRVARQLLAESGLCAIAGGSLGVAIAYVGVALVRANGPADLPRLEDVAVDGRVLAFTVALSALAGLGFGLVPAWDAMKSGLGGDLRSLTTPPRSRIRLRNALVVLQTAVALVLTIGAALLANSALRLGGVDPGFDPRDVLWIDVALPAHSYTTPAARGVFFAEAADRVRNVSGVTGAGGIGGRPLGGGNAVATVFPEGEIPASGDAIPRVPIHAVAPGYFNAMRIPLVDGRDVEIDDSTSAPRVAVVSRSFAERFWPGERAVGKRFWMGRVAADAPLTTIVGVAEDVRQYGLDRDPTPMVYRAFAQGPRASLSLVVRHGGRAPLELLQALRRAIWSVDASVPLEQYGTMEDHVSASISAPRFRASVLTALGGIAAILAAVGLYSTLAWIVRARRRELGIRITLGAGAGDVRWLVLRRGAVLTATGLAIGALVAAFATRALSTMMFGITATDVPTFAAAIVLMGLVAAIASWIPARRATALDPVETLRID